MKILAYTCYKKPYYYLTVLRYLLKLPDKISSDVESPRVRIIRYLFNLDDLNFEEFVMLISFSIHHSFSDVKMFFDHYYCNQWKEGNSYTGDSIKICEHSVYGEVKKHGTLIYVGYFKDKKYYGNGREYIEGHDILQPKIENHELKGWFQNGKKEGCFEYHSDGKGIREERFYLHGKRCGVQTSFYNSNGEKAGIEWEKVYYDGEVNGEIRECRERYYSKKGCVFNGKESPDTWHFLSPHVCKKESDPHNYYYLPTPGMMDKIKEYEFGKEYFDGEPIVLFSESKSPHLLCFSDINGDWGHICKAKKGA